MNRRGFLLSAIAAPVVIRTPGLLMPVKAMPVDTPIFRNTLVWKYDGGHGPARLVYDWPVWHDGGERHRLLQRHLLP